ncbi:MAG TPA: hypothetical protein VEK08_02160 [Planctomycetota bacterium]|nr:hypothetical protein [Planctomycetota bacterium]
MISIQLGTYAQGKDVFRLFDFLKSDNCRVSAIRIMSETGIISPKELPTKVFPLFQATWRLSQFGHNPLLKDVEFHLHLEVSPTCELWPTLEGSFSIVNSNFDRGFNSFISHKMRRIKLLGIKSFPTYLRIVANGPLDLSGARALVEHELKPTYQLHHLGIINIGICRDLEPDLDHSKRWFRQISSQHDFVFGTKCGICTKNYFSIGASRNNILGTEGSSIKGEISAIKIGDRKFFTMGQIAEMERKNILPLDEGRIWYPLIADHYCKMLKVPFSSMLAASGQIVLFREREARIEYRFKNLSKHLPHSHRIWMAHKEEFALYSQKIQDYLRGHYFKTVLPLN